MLIDVAIWGDTNVIKKEAGMWKVKTRVIPVIIGATGTISKSFRKYIRNIPGNHEVKELQKTAILGTAHILQKVYITGITLVFTFQMHCISIVRPFYFKIFLASFLNIFLSPEIATSINIHVPASLSQIIMSGLLLRMVLSVCTC